MSYWIVDGKQLTNEEYQELQDRKKLEKQRAREEEARLSRQLSEAYGALKEHLSRHKGMSQHITDERALEQKIYEKLQQNLERANEAPRCSAVREDGTLCGSPKMNDHIYCFAHRQMMKGRAKKLWLPPPEDANAIQMAVMLVQRALIDDEISEKKAGLLLYSIQIAAANVHKTTFGQARDEDMVTEIADEAEMIREHEQEMRRKTQGQGLPRMNADERGSEKQNLPLMNTEDTDRKTGGQDLPRMNADERGSGAEMAMGAEDIEDFEDDDLNEGPGKILPQPTEIAEVHANLCPSTRTPRVDGARLG